MSKINVIVNTKGGVGKSTVAYQIMPLIFDDVAIVEIDSSQTSKLQKSNVNSIRFTANKVSEAVDEIDILSAEKTVVIDVGADENVREFFKDIDVIDDLDFRFFIPLNDDVEYIQNVIDTHNMIEKFKPEAEINLILNRCRSTEEAQIKQQYMALFGSDEYALENVFEKLNIANVFLVQESKFFGIVKSKFQKNLFETEKLFKNILENRSDLRVKARKDSDKALKSVNANIRIAKQVEKLIKNIKKSFEILEKDK